MVSWETVSEHVTEWTGNCFPEGFFTRDHATGVESEDDSISNELVASSRGDFTIARNQNHGAAIPSRQISPPPTQPPALQSRPAGLALQQPPSALEQV